MNSQETSLSLEKINAERITRLESKVDRVIEMLGANMNRPSDWRGIGIVLAVIAATAGLLGQNILFINEQMNRHHNLAGHAEALQMHASHTARIASLETNQTTNTEAVKTDILHLDRLVHAELESIHNKINEMDVKIQQEIASVREYSKEQTRALDEKLQIEFKKGE